MGGEAALAAYACDPHLGASARARRQLPPGVSYMPKPWQPLDVLIAAEEATPLSLEIAIGGGCLNSSRGNRGYQLPRRCD
jgi:hypothetical protein